MNDCISLSFLPRDDRRRLSYPRSEEDATRRGRLSTNFAIGRPGTPARGGRHMDLSGVPYPSPKGEKGERRHSHRGTGKGVPWGFSAGNDASHILPPRRSTGVSMFSRKGKKRKRLGKCGSNYTKSEPVAFLKCPRRRMALNLEKWQGGPSALGTGWAMATLTREKGGRVESQLSSYRTSDLRARGRESWLSHLPPSLHAGGGNRLSKRGSPFLRGIQPKRLSRLRSSYLTSRRG